MVLSVVWGILNEISIEPFEAVFRKQFCRSIPKNLSALKKLLRHTSIIKIIFAKRRLESLGHTLPTVHSATFLQIHSPIFPAQVHVTNCRPQGMRYSVPNNAPIRQPNYRQLVPRLYPRELATLVI